MASQAPNLSTPKSPSNEGVPQVSFTQLKDPVLGSIEYLSEEKPTSQPFRGTLVFGLIKDTSEALGDLLKEAAGINTPKNDSKALDSTLDPIAEKTTAEKTSMIHHTKVIQEMAAKMAQIDYEEMMRIAINEINKPEMTEEDLSALKINTGFDPRKVMTHYHIAARRATMVQENRAAKQRDVAKIRSIGGKFDLNKIGEGGSTLSTTGGGGAG